MITVHTVLFCLWTGSRTLPGPYEPMSHMFEMRPWFSMMVPIVGSAGSFQVLLMTLFI